MKRIIFFVLAIVVVFSSCGKKEKEIKIIVPNGAPALAQIFLQKENIDLEGSSYTIDIKQGKDPLVSAFTAKSHDIIFAPLDLGAQLYSRGNFSYKLASIITFGNLYFATKTEDDFNLEALADKDIILFGEKSIPDIIAKFALENIAYKSLRYLPSTAETQTELVSDSSKIVLIAEPALSAAKQKINGLKTINLQTVFTAKTGYTYPQAGIFIKNNLIKDYQKAVDKYLTEVEKSANKVNVEKEEAADLAVLLEYGFPKPVLLNAIVGSNIGYKEALAIKADIEFILTKLKEVDSGLLSALPGKDFYYEKK